MSLDFSKAKYVGEYKEDNDTAEAPAFDFSQAKYVGEYKEEEAPRLPERTPQYDEYGTDITPERKAKPQEEIGVDIGKGVGPMRADAYRTNYAIIANLPGGTQRKIAESNSALAPVAQRVQSDDPLSSQIQTTTEGVSAKAAFRAKNGPVDTPQPELALGDAYSDMFWQFAVGANNIVGSPFSAVAPDSAPAQYFKRSADMLRNNYSPALQHKELAAKKKIDAARAKDGEWGGFTSSLKEYGTDPALSGMIMYETLPSMLGVIGPMRAAQVYSAARGLSPAAAASLASTTGGISNAVMNGGAARQEAYDTLLDAYTKNGMAPDEAKEAALKDSLLTLTVGAGMGFLGGKFGGEAAVMGLGAAGKSIGRGGAMAATKAGVGAGLREVASEQGEEVLPQVVTNSLASEHDGRSPFDGVGEIAAKTLIGTGPLAGVGAVSEAGRAYDPKGTALQDFADAIESTNPAPMPPAMGQDTAETTAARERALAAWNAGIGARRAPAPKTPEQVLTDIINDAPAESSAVAPSLPVEADAPVTLGAPATEAGQLDQQALLDQIERQVFGESGEQDGRQDQVSGDSRGDDAAGSGATVDGLSSVPLAGEGTTGTGAAVDVAGAAMGVPGQPGATLTPPEITVTPRKDGTAVVSGEWAQEAVAQIVPQTSMVQRADGSVLVGATYAPAVQQALQSMQTSSQPTATSVLQQTPTSLPIPQEIQRRMAKRTDAELDVIERTAKDPVTKSAAKKEKQSRAAPIMLRDDLVGAIMRITGGRGIDPGMALTLTGDTANRQPRLRGLFKNGGTADMSDLAELLRVEQGYDVRDGTHLEELIREQAAGNPVYSMERYEREAAENAEKEYRDRVNQRAVELGLKQARGKRTLAIVEADIARVEQEQSEMEAQEERAAIQAADIGEDIHQEGSVLTEADLMQWLGQQIDYTQEEIDEADSRASEIESRRAEAYSYDDTEGQAQGSGAERSGSGPAEGGTQDAAEGAGQDFQLDTYTESDLAAREAAERSQAEADAAADNKAEKDEQDRQFAQEVKRRSEAAASTFALGQDAMDNITGQGGLFEQGERQSSTADFIPAPNGKIDYGEITPEMAKAMRRQAGKIRLQQGVQNADGTGWGLAHIEARHGKEIRSAGFADVASFVSEAVGSIDAIWRPGKTSQLVAVQAGKKGKVVFLELQQARDEDGDFYRVNSAFPVPDSFTDRKQRKEGWERLWSGYPVSADVSGTSGFASKSPNAGETAPTVSPRSTSTVAPEAKESNPQQPAHIEDFGQKLEGARKDMPPSLKEELGDDEIASQPLSKIWPADAHEGIESDYLAALTFAARAEIPAKPRTPYKVRAWVSKVQAFREILQNFDKPLWREKLEEATSGRGVLSDFVAKVKLLEQLPRDTWKRVEKVGVYPDARRSATAEELKAVGLETRPYDPDKLWLGSGLYRIGSNDELRGDARDAAMWRANPFSRVTIDGKTHTIDGEGKIGPDEVQKVKELLGEAAPTNGGMTAKDFEIRAPRAGGSAFINRKGDSEYRKLKTFTGEDAVKQARDYLKGNTDALAAEWEKVKARDNVGKGDVRRDENRERTGRDWRNGKDVTPDMFQDALGFRGVQFGNWVSQGKSAKDRQGMLNEAYDALHDLADLLGIPPKAISLNGTMGLAFGARGSGKAAAHFEPSNLVINLTKTRGAGSLAHEWFHALDNYFARLRGGEVPMTTAGGQEGYRKNNYITYKPEPVWELWRNGARGPMLMQRITSAQLREELKKHPDYDASKTLEENAKAAAARGGEQWTRSKDHKEGVRPEVERAFAELVEALNASPMAKRANALDKAKDGYWGRIIERGARSFENYVISKMAARGWSNDYLANIRDWEQWQALGKNADRYPYLTPEEEAPVAEAFDALFDTVEAKETEQGVALYSRTQVNDKPMPALSRSDVAQAVAERFPSLERAVNAALRRGDEGKKGGLVVVEHADDLAGAFASKTGRGMDDAVQLLGSDENGQPQGLFDPQSGLTFLVGSALTTESAPAVLLHEAMHGKQREEIDARSMALIEGRARTVVRPTREFLNRVYQRMESAGEAGNQKEAAAYIVEEAVLAGRQAGFSAVDGKFLDWVDRSFGKRVGNIVRDMVAMVRAWVLRTGVGIQPSIDDLVALAKLNLNDMARGDGVVQSDTAERGAYSMAEEGATAESQFDNIVETITMDDASTALGDQHGIDEAERVFLSSFPEGTRTYRRTAPTARAAKAASDKAWAEFAADAGRTRRVAEPLGSFSGYSTRQVVTTGLNGKEELQVQVYGKEQLEAGLRDAPALTMTLDEDGEFSIYGPPSNSRIYKEFAKRGWAEPTRDGKGNIHETTDGGFWTKLTGATRQQSIGLLGDAHARGLDWLGVNHLGIHWKRTTGATGNTTGREGALYFSKSGKSSGAASQQPSNKPAPPEDTLARKTQRMWQDKLNRFTVIKEWLADNNVTLSEQGDVYKAEERMHSRFANKAQDFREKRVMPLVQKVQKAGFTMEDVAQFLHANHAQARNAQIAKINKSLPDGGSGMTNADAQAILASAPAELKALALEFRSITDDTTQILLSAGVIDQDAVNAWKNAYGDTYVPLKGGPDENAAKVGNGKGLSLKHKQKRALGHETRADGEWIIENILADHERALMAAEKNRVFHSLVKMALETAHLDLITINKPEKRQVLMNRTSYVVRKKGVDVASFQTEREARAFIQHDSAVTGSSRGDYTTEHSNDPSVAIMASPMPGPDEATGYINGHLVRVQFNDPLMAEAYNNMGAEAMGMVFRAGRALNGFFSKVYTGYNPEFIFTNILRDFTTGLANVTGEEGIAMAAKSAKNYAGRFLELAKYAATGNETKWVKMYREDGGNTGAAYLSDLERLGTDLQTEYAAYQGVMKNIAEGNYLTAARAAGRKTVGKLLNVIEVINMAGENAMRLAVYQSMVESGKSRAEAASMAKNVTVNFNRKGTMGAHANAVYLFFNAGVQGTASMAHAHFKGKHKYQAWAFSSSLAGIGYLLSLMAAADDEDDYEKTSEFDRSRNMLIKTENGYVKIPIPYGYGFFWNLGRGLADAQRTGEIGKMPWHVATSFVEEFTPFGAVVAGREPDGAQAFHGALPTALQIPHGILYNKTSFGAPMRPESGFDRNQPDRDKMNRPTRGTIADDLAGALESAGMDVSPETLKYLWRTGTGGAGTTVTSAIDAAKLKAQGADLDIKEIPFVRKLYTETDVRGARARYYEAKDEVDKALSAFKRAQKKGDDSLADKIEKENQELIDMAYMAKAMTAEIKAARDRIDSVRLSGEYTKAEERMIIKQMEKEEAELYDDFMAQFKTAKKEMRNHAAQRDAVAR